ncbi:MAG: HAD family phosphatase, partial [Nitrospinae bacterium]|nr:HAD family phosphatase [Nitrospinota bacterium]
VFELVVSGDDVTQGKPDPEIYRTVAQRLEVHPAECVVIEDAPAGVQAAKSAGMHCIAITNTVPRAQLQRADLIVDSLEDDLSPLLPP